jgi:hypothetical protein
MKKLGGYDISREAGIAPVAALFCIDGQCRSRSGVK